MVPRDELPEQYQPHRSFYGKLTCYLNGINPYPPGHKNNPTKSDSTIRNLGLHNRSKNDEELGNYQEDEESKEENKEEFKRSKQQEKVEEDKEEEKEQVRYNLYFQNIFSLSCT